MYKYHTLKRTSQMGERFVGTCIKCGRENLPATCALVECDSPSEALVGSEALINAIEHRSSGEE